MRQHLPAVAGLGLLAAAAACAPSGPMQPAGPMLEPGRSYGIVALDTAGAAGIHSFCQPTRTGRFIANNLSLLVDCDDPDSELVFGALAGSGGGKRETLRLADGSAVLVARLRDLDPDDVRPEASGPYVLAGRTLREGEGVFLTGRTLAYDFEIGAVHYLGRLGPGGIAWEPPGDRLGLILAALPELDPGRLRAEPPREVTLTCEGAAAVRSCRADPWPG